MNEETTNFWSENERQLVNGILDQIVPASKDGRVPAAGALDIADFLAAIASADPQLEKLLRHGFLQVSALVRAAGNAFEVLDAECRVAIVRQIEEQEPEFFQVLLRHTYMGYYSKPEVRPLFGLSSQPVHPLGYEVPEESPDLMAALVKPVKALGRRYREC